MRLTPEERARLEYEDDKAATIDLLGRLGRSVLLIAIGALIAVTLV